MPAILMPMGGVTLQRQAKALGDPTRFSIFTWIGEQPAPVTIIELKAEFTLNHTTIRQHLLQLCDAELLVESQAPPSGPGRPKRLYEVSPSAHGSWTHDGPYEQVAMLLLEMLRTGKSAREVGRISGRQRPMPLRSSSDPIEAMAIEAARQGFEPTIERSDGHADLVLTRCPFVEAAQSDPTTVCELHRGLAEGMAEAMGDVRVTDLVARPPSRAGCRMELAPNT